MLFVCSSVDDGTPISDSLRSVCSLLLDTPAVYLMKTLTLHQIPDPGDVAREVRRLKSMFILLLVYFNKALTVLSEKEMLFVCSLVEEGKEVPKDLQSVKQYLFDLSRERLEASLRSDGIPDLTDILLRVEKVQGMKGS